MAHVKEKLEFGLDLRKPANCVIHDLWKELIDRGYLFLVALVDGRGIPAPLSRSLQIIEVIIETNWIIISLSLLFQIEPSRSCSASFAV